MKVEHANFLSAVAAPFGGADTWAQFGLAGLVIFALFGFLYVMAKSLIDRVNRSETQKQAFLNQMLQQHQTERQEWRNDSEKSREAHTAAIEKLSKATVDALHEVRVELTALRTVHEAQLRGG